MNRVLADRELLNELHSELSAMSRQLVLLPEHSLERSSPRAPQAVRKVSHMSQFSFEDVSHAVHREQRKVPRRSEPSEAESNGDTYVSAAVFAQSPHAGIYWTVHEFLLRDLVPEGVSTLRAMTNPHDVILRTAGALVCLLEPPMGPATSQALESADRVRMVIPPWAESKQIFSQQTLRVQLMLLNVHATPEENAIAAGLMVKDMNREDVRRVNVSAGILFEYVVTAVNWRLRGCLPEWLPPDIHGLVSGHAAPSSSVLPVSHAILGEQGIERLPAHQRKVRRRKPAVPAGPPRASSKLPEIQLRSTAARPWHAPCTDGRFSTLDATPRRAVERRPRSSEHAPRRRGSSELTNVQRRITGPALRTFQGAGDRCAPGPLAIGEIQRKLSRTEHTRSAPALVPLGLTVATRTAQSTRATNLAQMRATTHRSFAQMRQMSPRAERPVGLEAGGLSPAKARTAS